MRRLCGSRWRLLTNNCFIMLSALVLGIFTFVQLNCENFFDCVHDSLKQDEEYTAGSPRHWNSYRYWQKLRNISKEILSCSQENGDGLTVIPDLVALCEIENDSVAHYLTKRSLLRNARYEYLITRSPDVRGIDVALLYSPMTFRLINSYPLRVASLKGMRPTRDILYASGEVLGGDTLHVFVLHAPSRFSGKRASAPYRMAVMRRLMQSVDSLRSIHREPKIIVSGDFNDESEDESVRFLANNGLAEVSAGVKGMNGAKGTYKYQGVWGSIDHILISGGMKPLFRRCILNDLPFLLEDDSKFGGKKPFRTYWGYRYLGGFSDHLPLVAVFEFGL